MGFLKQYFKFLAAVNDRIELPIMNHILNQRHTLMERLFWIHIALVAIFGGCYMCYVQYLRYSANPTVVTLERNFHDWNGTLPSITFCYEQNFSPDLIQQFIQDKWNLTPTDTQFEYYSEFLTTLGQTNLLNLVGLASFADDEELNKLDLLPIINKLLMEFDHYVSTFIRNYKEDPLPVITEKGICYSANSVKSRMIAVKWWDIDHPNKEKVQLKCYAELPCMIKVDFYGFNVSVAVHSPDEVVRFESFFYDLNHNQEISATFKQLETINENSVQDLSLQQRKCLFDNEHQNGLTSYSVNLCLMKCRADAAIVVCGCKPYFYPFVENGVDCNLVGLKCLIERLWPLNIDEESCDCPKPCNNVLYTENLLKARDFVVVDSGIPFAQKSSFRVDILPPKMRLRREVLFTFEDLVVSIGSALTLFIGCNLIMLGQLGHVLLDSLFHIPRAAHAFAGAVKRLINPLFGRHHKSTLK